MDAQTVDTRTLLPLLVLPGFEVRSGLGLQANDKLGGV